MLLSIVEYHYNKESGYVPLVDFEASGSTLEANANNIIKYIAQITLSTATLAAKTDGETPRASEIAM